MIILPFILVMITKMEIMKRKKNLKKFLKKSPFTVTFNQHFDEVLEKCAKTVRKHEKGTWITETINDGYKKLFAQGGAYSVDVLKDGELVGGLYGVCIGEIFSGESMFHTETNASKIALISIMQVLQKAGIPFLDSFSSVVSSFRLDLCSFFWT